MLAQTMTSDLVATFNSQRDIHHPSLVTNCRMDQHLWAIIKMQLALKSLLTLVVDRVVTFKSPRDIYHLVWFTTGHGTKVMRHNWNIPSYLTLRPKVHDPCLWLLTLLKYQTLFRYNHSLQFWLKLKFSVQSYLKVYYNATACCFLLICIIINITYLMTLEYRFVSCILYYFFYHFCLNC